MRLSYSTLYLLSLIPLSLTAAAADRAGVSASAYVWNTSADARFSQSRNNVEIESDTEASETTGSKFFVVAATFKPRWAPSIRLRFTDLQAESTDDATARTVFRGVPVTARDSFDSSYEFDFYELNASWRLKRSVFYFDYGLSLQYLEGTINNAGEMISNREEVKTPLPALHLGTGVSLRRQMTLDIEVQGAAFDGDSLLESEFTFSVLPDKKSGVVIGYRIFDLDFSNDNVDINVDFRGGFLGARLGF